MKRSLMDILCCPLCKGNLELSAKKATKIDIIQGNLYCKKCNIHYPIEDGIPNMLPPDLR